MKKILPYITLTSIVYLAFAFIKADANFINWGEELRMILCLVILFSNALLKAWLEIIKNLE